MFACIHVPDFPVQAVQRSGSLSSEFSANDQAVAVLDGPPSLVRVFACNELARRLGVAPGTTQVQAESFPDLILRRRSIEHEESAQAALLDCAGSFSSQVESTASGSAILDATGTERLFGSSAQLGSAVLRSAAKFGFQANVAMAANPDTAFYAAQGFAGLTVIPPGEEAVRLRGLPLHILNIAPDVHSRLESMGIRNFGALAALPPVPFSQRFGQTGLQLQSIARGETQRLLVRAESQLRFAETFEFEDAVDNLEPLAFILNRLLDQLVERLKARSLGTNGLHLQLGLERNNDRDIRDNYPPNVFPAIYERTIQLPVSTQDQRTLLKLLQLDLAEHPPSSPVKTLLLEAAPAALRFAQGGLFDRIAPEPEQLQVLLGRLRGIVGEADPQGRNRVGTPRMRDTHAPDAFALKEFSVTQDTSSLPVRPLIALRLYRPPRAASVKMTGGKPDRISFAPRLSAFSRIIAASGPWRSTGSWWEKSEGWERDEWDIALQAEERTELYRIYKDEKRGWFVDGVYD
ncbi:MAG TPA: DNA polymerase Y family protein [Alphaproteobacteria bacterium]|nr:DNA polymerase Y family protein [Alphaproteobacteria bacterium]